MESIPDSITNLTVAELKKLNAHLSGKNPNYKKGT